MGVKVTCLLSFVLQGLDNVSSATLRPFNSDINTPRIDSYRFSMANLEGKLAHLSLARVYRPRFPPVKVTRSVGDLYTCQIRDVWKSRFERRVSTTRAIRPAWWLLPDFSAAFFSLRSIFLAPSSKNDGSPLTVPLDRSAAPFAISSSWILVRVLVFWSFVSSRFCEGSGRLPWCVNFSSASCAALSYVAPTRISLRGDINRVTKIDWHYG